jgi:4-hydroxybenzoate polyprenyltransferase
MPVVTAWLGRLIAIQEKRTHRFAVCFGIVAFVAIGRFLLEWIVANRSLAYVNDAVLVVGSFYLMVLFLYTAILTALTALPWRTCMNVVMAGLFCGLLPPLIDGVVYGLGAFTYEYVTGFPRTWPWTLYSPGQGLPLGESTALWLSIALSALYVWRKTFSLARAAAAAALAYLAVAYYGAALATLLLHARPSGAWGGVATHVITFGQLGTTVIVYCALQPSVALGLLRRAHHTLPFLLIASVGAALTGRPGVSTWWAVLLLLFAFLVALAQNDLFDRAEDARQGRPAYLDAEDVAVLNAIFLLFCATLAAIGSILGYLLLTIFVVSVLYSYPMYRAKRFFPANLKIEGVWGAASFLVGVVSVMTPATSAARPASAPVASAFGAETVAALALVFGGWSLVAVLKDYKDLRADARSGVQTVYTLAVRRGWGLRRVHRWVSTGAATALVVPFPLLVLARSWATPWVTAGLPFAAMLLWATSRAPSRREFRAVLLIVSALLVSIFGLLVAQGDETVGRLHRIDYGP